MKKTFITLLALAGVAMGADKTIDLATQEWNIGYQTALTDGVLTFNSGGWGVNLSSLDLDSISLDKNQVLTLSVTHNYNTYNTLFTMALVNKSGAVVMGQSFSNEVRFATTTETGESVKRGYAFGGTNNSAEVANITEGYVTLKKEGSESSMQYVPNSGSTVKDNVSVLTVAYDQQKEKFVATLTYDNVSNSITLGDTFTVDSIAATFTGDTETSVTAMSLSVATVPEPTTAALSLLALAGLAARRRRK